MLDRGEITMNEIIGIVPGAGRASRIGGFFKELTPINVNPVDPSRLIVVSERIIDLLRRSGASPIYFVLNEDKGVISEYFNKSSLFSTDSLYFAFQSSIDKYYGMPFAIDKTYHESRGKTVLLGMPDTLIEPDDAFEILVRNFHEHKSDLELGLFKTQPDNFGGYVEFDARTSRVTYHIDKTARDFPRDRANNSWAIACWNDRFTEFLHKFVEDRREEYRFTGFGHFKELLFGDVIDAAISSRDIVVTASFVSEERGYYLDITEPAKYFQAVLHYHTPRGRHLEHGNRSVAGNRERLRVFISHSSKQKAYADDLHFMLKQAGYDPILDSYDIKGGQQIPKRIESLIRDSDYFVLLLSNESVNSRWVQVEISLAYAAGLLDKEQFLPVEIDGIPDEVANSIPLIPRSSYNWLDGTHGLRGVLTWINDRETQIRLAGLTNR